MAYLALYRRYRPTDFDKLIGQEHIVKTLVNQIKNDRLGHAYLFTGTRGTGKTSCAKIFAKAINCEHPVNGSPCGECPSCKALSDPSNIDVIEIDAASNNGVNEIRELRENVQYPPVSCKYKVYIIDEVHMLTGAAFNALLKTLEEPPKHAVFILATTEAHKIPATILSRCMRFDFRLIPTERIAKLISDIYDELNKPYEKEAVFAIARAGEGSIRDALSIADIALSHNEGKLTYEDVNEVLGSTNRELISKFIDYVLSGNTGKVLESIDELSMLGKSMGVLAKDVTDLLRDLLVAKTCKEKANDIIGLPENEFNKLKECADNNSEIRILRAMGIFSDVENTMKFTTHPRIIFETAAIKASRPESDFDIESLSTRIKTLEDKIASGNFQVKTENTVNVKVQEIPKIQEQTNSVKLDNDNVKGILLRALRINGSEMLWGVLQNAEVEISSGVITICSSNPSDRQYLDMSESKAKMIDALRNYGEYNIIVKESNSTRSESAMSSAIDDVKSCFGDDIVIIK